MRKILVIDDDPHIADVIEQYFDGPEYAVCTLVQGEKASETVSRIMPDLILLDLKLPDIYGMDILKDLKRRGFQVPIVIITGNVSAEVAIEAMKEGAYEYLPKPFSLAELGRLVDRLLARAGETKTASSLQEQFHDAQGTEEFVGRSPEIMKIAKIIGHAASSDAPILLKGESGTGKELIAKIIHQNSRRKDKPFMVVSCAYPSGEMLEDELFGRSGKTDQAPGHGGKLELCNGGTIFLDDIERLGLSTQGKLLEVLKSGEISTMENPNVKIDIRIIAASSGDLTKSGNEGKFLQELFYNLRVISIFVPPLRERKSDIPILARHFLNKYRNRSQKMIVDISPEAMKLLMTYCWPGNVRELENNIYSAMEISLGDQILPEHLPIFYSTQLPAQLNFLPGEDDCTHLFMQTLEPLASRLFKDFRGEIHDRLIDSLEKAVISMALKHCQGNQVKAAELLGISRNTLRERMSNFGLYQKKEPAG
jgi:DNA-binding NtrC family response regulator